MQSIPWKTSKEYNQASHQVHYYLTLQSLTEVDATRCKCNSATWSHLLLTTRMLQNQIWNLVSVNIWIQKFIYKWTHLLMHTNTVYMDFHSLLSLSFQLTDKTIDKVINLLNDLLWNYWTIRIYWPGYPSKCLYVKHAGH